MCMSSRRQNGFTLIELIIFIVVVGAGLAGILSVMNTVVKSSADPLVSKQTVAIAESMLQEVLLKDYANPTGGYTGSSRALFDDVDDYNGYSSTSIFDLTGTAVASLAGYRIAPAVVVTPVTMGGITVKRVVVTVTGPQGAISLIGFRANY